MRLNSLWLFLVAAVSAEVSTAVFDMLEEMTGFSAVAYCIDKYPLSTGRLSCPIKFCVASDIQVLSVHTGRATCYLAEDSHRRRLVLVFRGSQNAADYIDDSLAYPAPYSPLSRTGKDRRDSRRVHLGFMKALKDYYYSDEFARLLKLLEDRPDWQLVITGHSLGGALAGLMAAEMKVLGYSPLVVTVAAPKIGNSHWADWSDDNFETPGAISQLSQGVIPRSAYIRLEHHGDQVPRLQPSFLGWKHAGVGFEITKIKLPHTKKDVSLVQTNEKDDLEPGFLKEMSKYQQKCTQWLVSKFHNEYFFEISNCE